jgi:hypothetical protein
VVTGAELVGVATDGRVRESVVWVVDAGTTGLGSSLAAGVGRAVNAAWGLMISIVISLKPPIVDGT